jgi:hypothetical protein
MGLKVYATLEQGTPEWFRARAGIVTASVVGLLITPKTLKLAANETARGLTETLVAERITEYVEVMHPTADMERGTLDEPYARAAYAEHYAPVSQVGFMVRSERPFRLGYSPDGLVGDDGLIEIKSRKQKKQLATILADEVPLENMAQLQAGLLVSGRAWIDYVSYCGGMPLYVKRVYPDGRWFAAIRSAAVIFEENAARMLDVYRDAVKGRPETVRIDHYADMEIGF